MPHAGLDVRSLLVYSRVRLVRGSRAGRAVFRGEIVVPAGHGCAFGPGADDCLCRVLRFLPSLRGRHLQDGVRPEKSLADESLVSTFILLGCGIVSTGQV